MDPSWRLRCSCGRGIRRRGGRMLANTLAQDSGQGVTLAGSNLTLVAVVTAVSVAALGMAFLFRTQVLAAGEGTEKMKEIARAVQEGASAYLGRQFRTLGWFVVIVFALLFLLPADDGSVRIG